MARVSALDTSHVQVRGRANTKQLSAYALRNATRIRHIISGKHHLSGAIMMDQAARLSGEVIVKRDWGKQKSRYRADVPDSND